MLSAYCDNDIKNYVQAELCLRNLLMVHFSQALKILHFYITAVGTDILNVIVVGVLSCGIRTSEATQGALNKSCQ